MIFNNKTMQAVSTYETPTVTTLEVLSEGVLCGSYGDPNAPGKDLSQENEWDF